MTYPTFSPPHSPSSNGTRLVQIPRMRVTRFGDGYSQRIPDGINTYPHKATLAWDVLSFSDAQTIDSFFVGLAGGVFQYQIPDDTVSRKWTVTTWTRQPFGGSNESVTAELVEEFDP